jgi:hypothetical protein
MPLDDSYALVLEERSLRREVRRETSVAIDDTMRGHARVMTRR